MECYIISCMTKIAYFSASNTSQNSEKTGRKLGNQVIRKGYMAIHNLGIMKGVGDHVIRFVNIIPMLTVCEFSGLTRLLVRAHLGVPVVVQR